MADSPSLIMIQFLAWVADRPRSYSEVMAAWRSTCPRLSVWEDAIIGGLVRTEGGGGRAVTLTGRGRVTLANAQRPQSSQQQKSRKREPARAGAAAN